MYDLLQSFISEEISTNHENVYLESTGKKGFNKPDKDNSVQFNKNPKQMDASFVIYAEFKCNLKGG